MKALILAGGFGTRLKDAVKNVPKPMAMIAGKPFLEHQLHFLKEQNIDEIILAVHYMPEVIKSYFGGGGRWGVHITYSEEDTPLGTAGAIKNAERYLDDTFFVLNGDSYSKMNLMKFLDFHISTKSDFSIGLAKSQNSAHYGHVIIQDDKIIEFAEKKKSGESVINRGVYLFEPKIFNEIAPGRKISLEEEIFPRLAEGGKLYGYSSEDYFIDIGRPETYHQFKKDILENLVMKKQDKVREAMQKITKNGINIVLVTDKEKKLLGVLNDRIIKEYILKGGNLEDGLKDAMIKDPITAKIDDDEDKISELLLYGINYLPILNKEGKISDVKFRIEEIETKTFPTIRGKAPLRISFAGGGTDVSNFFEKYGGVVINSTIDKYCHATAIKRADSKIIINSDMDEEITLDSKKLDYDGKFDLIKALVKVMNPNFGFELYLNNDIPSGRGLGSSASLTVLITKLISQLQGIQYSDEKIAEIAYRIEHEELKIKGGWQDQYAAVTGGFSFMEFGKDKTIIYPLRLKEDTINELNSSLILCYTGKSHYSGEIHKKQEKYFLENEEKVVKRLDNLKNIAEKIKDCLLRSNLEEIGELLHNSWQDKKKLVACISNNKINELYEIGMKNGANGGKLLGAGGGGYLLFSHSPKKRNQLVRALENNGGEIMNFNFESKGIQTWSNQSKF
jgi:D-glycero-alpha-D-manno-heptose-7-phosphate kinase